MREILGFIRLYIKEINLSKWIVASCWITLLVYLNYSWDLEGRIYQSDWLPLADYSAPFLVYAIAYYPPLCLILFSRPRKKVGAASIIFWMAPVLFAIKVGANTYISGFENRDWELYWNKVLYWPLRLSILFPLLWFISSLLAKPRQLLGLTTDNLKWKPYLQMLLIMVPLIGAASTQTDFLEAYPRLRQITPLPTDASFPWLYRMLFELGYGTDFVSIEVFFRGLLVVGFSRWLGKDAILPMACFYCSIHFGKPLGECISSFFGGTLLGIVSYHTRNVYGGLLVHLGIAWMMEAGGYFGNLIKG